MGSCCGGCTLLLLALAFHLPPRSQQLLPPLKKRGSCGVAILDHWWAWFGVYVGGIDSGWGKYVCHMCVSIQDIKQKTHLLLLAGGGLVLELYYLNYHNAPCSVFFSFRHMTM